MPEYPLLEAVIEIGTWETGAEIYPDTGFEGGLAIPEDLVEEIERLPRWSPIRTADGTIHHAPSWSARIEVAGRRFGCEAIALGPKFLLGREVLDQLDIRFVFGRQVLVSFGDE